MGWSTHRAVGLIHREPQKCFRGYTLFTNATGGYDAYLMDLEGRICHRWHSHEGILYAYLLPNGHLLMRTHPPRDTGPTTLRGGAAAIQELDWDSEVVWEYRNPLLHLDFERLPSGNTLVLMWEQLPSKVASRVSGGYRADDDPEMHGDIVQEVAPDGTLVSEWRSWEHLSFEDDIICPLETRREWTHCNALNVTSDKDLLVSFRQISVVGIVDRTTGDFRWKWGPGQVSHQHHPTYLGNGRVLLFDNGSHRLGRPVPYSGVIEVDVETNRSCGTTAAIRPSPSLVH